jgi:hypothetical protein
MIGNSLGNETSNPLFAESIPDHFPASQSSPQRQRLAAFEKTPPSGTETITNQILFFRPAISQSIIRLLMFLRSH